MNRKKITRIMAIALATITVTSGAAFASTNIGEQFLKWANTKVSTVINQITVDNNALTTQLQNDANTNKTESKAAVTEYGKVVGDEKVDDLKKYGDEYIKELEDTVTQLEADIPKSFDEFVAKITKQTTASLDAKGNEIKKKIDSSTTGFGGELWSAQNSTKQVMDRKIRVSSAEIQNELKATIQEARKEIEVLIQNEDATAREEIKANVDKAYENACEKIKDSLNSWEVSAKDTLDEISIQYYNTQVEAINKVVEDSLTSELAN